MDNRAYEANASATPPTAPGAPSSGYPKPGNPATSDPATKPGPFWVYAIGEELRGVITWAGLTPDLNDLTQLRQAIMALINAAVKSIHITGATFAAGVANGEAVRWDSGAANFAKAIADGTANNQAVGFADVTNGVVHVRGETPALFSGLTPGGRYYLSATTAGAITTVAPADRILVGFAKSATVLFVDIDPLSDVNYKVGTLLMWPSSTVPSWALVRDGSAVNRATYSALMDILCPTMSGTLTSGSPVVTGLSTTTGLFVGEKIEGTGVPAGAAILSIDSPTQVTLSVNATVSGAQTLRPFPYGAGDGSTNMNLMDDRDLFERGWASGARGYDKTVLTGSTTNGSAIVTALSSTTGMYIGMAVSGAGIPGGATILSIQSAAQVTLSANATNTAAGVSLTFTGRRFGHEQVDDFMSHAHTYGSLVGSGAGLTSGGTPYSGGGTTSATGGAETRPRNRAYLPIVVY